MGFTTEHTESTEFNIGEENVMRTFAKDSTTFKTLQKQEDDPKWNKLNRISDITIGAAINVHRALGPGLLESAYEAYLSYEITDRGLTVSQQKPLPVVYREESLDCAYRLDMLVEEQVIVEIKSVEALLAIHKAQMISYLKLSGCPLGLLINFNVPVLKNGINRLVN